MILMRMREKDVGSLNTIDITMSSKRLGTDERTNEEASPVDLDIDTSVS